jgi:proteic killer suppression protein
MPLDDSTIAVLNELLAERDKLDQIESAASLEDLRAPPGNRLERLRGDRRGQHSVRINVRYRVCFRWTSQGPEQVEIVDYHRG